MAWYLHRGTFRHSCSPDTVLVKLTQLLQVAGLWGGPTDHDIDKDEDMDDDDDDDGNNAEDGLLHAKHAGNGK